MNEFTTEIDSLAEWVHAYRYAKENEAKWRETADEVRAKLVAHLTEHDAEVGTLDGAAAVKYVPVTSRRLDSKALKSDHPELAAQYTNEQTSYRFTVVE